MAIGYQWIGKQKARALDPRQRHPASKEYPKLRLEQAWSLGSQLSSPATD